MRTADALANLASLQPTDGDLSSELSQKGDIAYLRVSSGAPGARWAVVSSPGDRWFSLDVDGGFSLDHLEEETPDEDARHILERLVGLAVLYIVREPTPTKSRIFRVPFIELPTEDGAVLLRKSLAGVLKNLFRLDRRSER
jgi:hypothetical protein